MLTQGDISLAGLSGPARASVGAVRDFILGTQVLNGRAPVGEALVMTAAGLAVDDPAQLYCGDVPVYRKSFV